MPQEANMAELLRLMKNMIVKVDDLATDMKDVKSDVKELKTSAVRVEGKVDRLEVKVDRLEVSVGRLEGKTDSIATAVMTNDRRLTAVEYDVAELKSREH
jgi:outer membrane murein-binding lipoprotein Lpp